MSIKDDQREKVIERLARHLLETGLARTSLRELARAAGVSDRMLLYYFTDKAEVLAAAAIRVSDQVAREMDAVLAPGVTLPPAAMVLLSAEMTATPPMRRFMRLWIEMVAAAARQEEPFVTIAAQVLANFRSFVVPRLDVPAGTDREALAGAIIAVIDGLALVDVCSTEPEMRATHKALAGLLG
jgi:AcrR family transcriptional regulator